jgi:hypothetical protein
MPGRNGVMGFWRLRDSGTEGRLYEQTFFVYNQRTTADMDSRESENQSEFPPDYRF